MSDRDYMGTPEAAKAALIEKARVWREYRQPLIATAKEHKKREALEREAKFQLANAALLWLWHEENPTDATFAENYQSSLRAAQAKRTVR